jgi:hypothetical protein
MPRSSKLTPAQWRELEQRLNAGERMLDLAKDYGIHHSQIVRRFPQHQSHKVKEVAQRIAQTESALAELPVRDQYSALSLAQKLRSASEAMASGVELAAKNFSRLHALANSELQKVDDVNPLQDKSGEALKGVVVLSKAANECGSGAALLLNGGNKDIVKRALDDKGEEEALTDEHMEEGAKRIAFVLRRIPVSEDKPA